MNRTSLKLIALASLALCTLSCRDLTHVQNGYISDRDDCQSRASYGMNAYTTGAASISPKEKGNMAQQLFCECMKDREWSVAGCKFNIAKTPTPVPVQQPTIVVVQQAPPAAVIAAPPAAEPLACPAPPKGKKRAKRRLDGTCPAPEEYSQTELDNVLNKQ